MFRIQQGKFLSLEEKRTSIIQALNEALTSFKSEVSIVFDSSQQIRDYAQSAELFSLEVIYAPRGQTADEYIIELVQLSKNPKIKTVVTSDSGLARQCEHLGAKVLSTEDFIAFVLKKMKKKPSSKKEYKESPAEIERLLEIFEKKAKKKK